MPVYISLIRGINVGGKRMKMEDLRALYESLGLAETQTLLQSGNAVFRSERTDTAQLARQLEDGIEARFGFRAGVILRTLEAFRQAVAHHPLSAEMLADPGKTLVMFLANEPPAEAVAGLIEAHSGPEIILPQGQEIYVYYAEGVGRSKLTHTVIEKKLKVRGTARNWNTVTRLLELAEGLAAS